MLVLIMYWNALFELSMLDGCFGENNSQKICESVDVAYGLIWLFFVLIGPVLLLSQLC